jgi:translation initiation factor IF-2
VPGENITRELRLQKEKVRIFALARELDMESKQLLAFCQSHGIDVKNQLSTVEPEQCDQIKQLVKQSGGGTATLAPPRPTVLPPVEKKVAVLPSVKRPTAVVTAKGPAKVDGADAETVAEVAVSPPEPTELPVKPSEAAAIAEPPAMPKAAEAPPAASAPEPPPTPRPPVLPPARVPTLGKPPTLGSRPVSQPRPPEAPKPVEPQAPPKKPEPPVATPAAAKHLETPAAAAPPTPPTPPPAQPRPPLPQVGGGGMRNLGSTPRTGGRSEVRIPRAHGPQTRPPQPTPPPSGGPKPPPAPKPPPSGKPGEQKFVGGVKKLGDIPADLLESGQSRNTGQIISTILQRQREASKNVTATVPESVEVVADDDDDVRGKKGKGGSSAKKPGELAGRDARHKERVARQEKRKSTPGADLKGRSLLGVLDAEDESDRAARILARHKKNKQKQQKPTEARKGRVPIEVPITVRSLCEAIGVNKGKILFDLSAKIPNVTINSVLDPDLAEDIAIEHGCDLEIKKPLDAEEKAIELADKEDAEDQLVPRAPIVTIMGHVDHGKTSLLDKIRGSRVVDTEAGGITQVIRAWRVDHNGKPITFLDTPGHEAFTKMRARGANVTDIAVIVVAADDGVMPQTEEAISHAKAAGVATIVAINKIDLPNSNLTKTQQQLYSLNVLPDNMGGDTPFVQTSATTGKGIDDLLEAINLVAELRELKANPNRPAVGTCLEAYLDEGEGVQATMLVQKGTLRRGDVMLCGHTYGRVRAMYNDLGKPIDEAGPSMPVRITGLDAVPNADDQFVVLDDLSEAHEIAEKRKFRIRAAALPGLQLRRFEDMDAPKITELKVILKAEARGSIEAIKKELEKLHHEEVRVRILHTGIGAITENDVTLALTSPRDTLVLGFNVVPDDAALKLAEERGIQIREYDIIYNLTNDVRAALEGKLKPREEVVHLGRAVVRETFKISRVGTIAGCYVTSGTIERSAKVRVIRAGVVIYPPADRTVGLESLKRFKEDVREVREGFECGMKVAGYDDIKVDDVIEAYRVEQVQRTLS